MKTKEEILDEVVGKPIANSNAPIRYEDVIQAMDKYANQPFICNNCATPMIAYYFCPICIGRQSSK